MLDNMEMARMRFRIDIKKFLIWIYMFGLMLFKDGDYFKAGTRLLFLGGSLLLFCIQPLILKRKLNYFFVWMLLFFVSCCISLKYTISLSTSMSMISTIGLGFLTLLTLFLILQSRPSLVYFIGKWLILFPCILGIYTYGRYGIFVYINKRTLSSPINANTVGLECAIAAVLALYGLWNYKKALKQSTRIWLRIAVGLNIVFLIMTASRKAILAVVVALAIYSVISSNDIIKRTRNLILGFAVLALVFEMILNIPFLYDIIGYRMEGMMNYFNNSGGEVDASTSTRMKLIEYGMTWFSSSPLFGHGIDNYRNLLSQVSGLTTYAHNNFVELLVDVGLVGFASYYYIHIRSLVGYLRNRRNADNLQVLAISILVVLLITDYGLVSYFNKFINLLLCLIAFILSSNTNIDHEENNHYEYKKSY